jgi:hypothetical protein
MLRRLVDGTARSRLGGPNKLTEEQLVAEGDKSPGVLIASGYIAGGAIAGIVIAFVAGVMSDTQASIDAWASAHNPFFSGPNADLLSLLPFGLIAALLYWVGRQKVVVTSG